MPDAGESPMIQAISRELAEPVPVREEWRAALLSELATTELRREGFVARLAGSSIRLRPLVAAAAAIAFTVFGAGVTALVLLRDGARNLPAAREVAASIVPSYGGATSQREVEFVLSAPMARHVALVGDFNRWDPALVPLSRDPETGEWRIAVRLPPGRHVYAFVVDGDLVADPTAARAAADDFGQNSVIMVSSR